MSEIKDDKFIGNVVEENIHHSDVEKLAVRKKEAILFTTESNTMREISDKEQKIYDKDAASFKIVPAIETLKEGDVVRLYAISTTSIANDPNVAWHSDNWDAAYFTENSTLHANKPGEAKILAVDVENQTSASFNLTVVSRNMSAEQKQSQENAQSITDALSNGEKNVTIEEGTVKEVNIPSTITSTVTVTAELEDGCEITSESTKGITINNTSEEPVNVSVQANGSTYLTGKYNNININGKGISNASGKYAEIYGEVTIDPEHDGNVSITADFCGDSSAVNYQGDDKLTISNHQSESLASLTIDAPNATVEIGGKYDTVTATVSENTLVLKEGFHANKLVVLKGNVEFLGADVENFVDEATVPEGSSIGPRTYEITNASIAGFSKAGVSNVTEDVVSTSRVAFGITASGSYRYNLNGHSVSLNGKTYGAFLLRGGNINIDVYGPGKIINTAQAYGIWLSSASGTVNIYGGDFEAYTHVLYTDKGTINVYGGSFKLLGSPELDEKGHCKFLLNCLDAAYKSGEAKINVFGGKFYNFNPAESYSEPAFAPVSFVAEGYHVVETEEEGTPVFEVVPNE